MPAVSAKGGNDGNQIGGNSLQPAQESHEYYSIYHVIVWC